jgi:hypothetical protein
MPGKELKMNSKDEPEVNFKSMHDKFERKTRQFVLDALQDGAIRKCPFGETVCIGGKVPITFTIEGYPMHPVIECRAWVTNMGCIRLLALESPYIPPGVPAFDDTWMRRPVDTNLNDHERRGIDPQKSR